jgi:hypothetical protein
LEAILEKWDKVTIAIVYNTERPSNLAPRLREYADECDRAAYASGKNPFKPHEVKAMWQAAIDQRGLTDRIAFTYVKRREFEAEFLHSELSLFG